MNKVYTTEIKKSPRIQGLIDELYSVTPTIESTRAEILTESFKATEGMSIYLRRSAAFKAMAEKRLGGRLVTLIIKGKVSAVKAAIEAGVNDAKPLGKVHGNAVIANPHGEIMKFFDYDVE